VYHDGSFVAAFVVFSHLVHSHFSLSSHTAVNKRVFDISVEGQMINDLDLVQLGGGVAFKALTRQVNVQVSDGFLTIQLLDNVPLIDFPKLSAIEVRSNSGGGGGGGPSPTPPLGNFSPIRINCGGLVPYTDSQGRVWSADQFFLGGTVFDSAAPIADTVDDPLYNCERYGQATYSIPVPEGSYTVVLHLSEI
jgi:trimeric autotransporter adhesin